MELTGGTGPFVYQWVQNGSPIAGADQATYWPTELGDHSYNVLVKSESGRPFPVVIDFGSAKATGSTHPRDARRTEVGRVVGTREYMSPEQAAGSADIDTRSDVFSLGVLMYVMLTGSLPDSGPGAPTPSE